MSALPLRYAGVVNRIGFVLKVRAERVEAYKAHHQQVWPEMRAALTAGGWHNYSLFIRQDGLLFGYFETPESLAVAQAKMAETELNDHRLEDGGLHIGGTGSPSTGSSRLLLDLKLVLITFLKMVLQIRLDHLLCQLPSRYAKISPRPQVPPPVSLLQSWVLLK